jgi:mannose-6-phosphate isomerase-like protein (cupin superfamily)
METAERNRALQTMFERAQAEQSFAVSHLDEADFKPGGRKGTSLYRDLGFSEATHGLVQAHVIRPLPNKSGSKQSEFHYHVTTFQMVYVLKGWAKMEIEGYGELTVRPGSAWIQPPGIRHAVLDFSDDYEVLELYLPGHHETVNLQR